MSRRPVSSSSSTRKRHGRNGAKDNPGATKVSVSHETLQAGDPCPECAEGTLYESRAGVLIRIVGRAPVQATVYELQKLRCNLCGKLFTAKAPEGIGSQKYDASPESFDNERYRNVSSPQLFVYLPAKEKARGTALIIGPGGGYVHLATCLHVENVVKLLNDHGIAVFGLKYRTLYANNDVAEDALADGKRAVRIVRSRAKQWGIDPGRIGLQGYSAGGHLALNLACRFDEGHAGSPDPIERFSSRPDFVVLMCPWPYKQSLSDFPLSKRSPPAFIASAKDDKTAPFAFAAAIDRRLVALGVQEMLFSPETGGHGAFHVGMVEGPGAQWPDALLAWLEEIDMLK